MFKVAIPSYNRLSVLKTKCLQFLKEIGILEHQIYIFIDPRSFQEYTEDIDLISSDYNLIEGKEGLANQRNYIRNFFKQGENIMHCDDDLINLIPHDNVKEEIEKTFNEMKKQKILLCGFEATGNRFFVSPEKRTLLVGAYFAVGCCYLEVNSYHSSLYLKETENEKEDYKRTIAHLRLRGKVLRNNKLSVVHRSLSQSMGGMDIQTRNQERQKALKNICEKYSYLFNTRKKKQGLELQFKNNMKRIQLKFDLDYNIEYGDYPDLTAYLYELPRPFDYEGYDGETLVFRLLRNKFKWKDINKDSIQYYLETMSKLSSNRGNLAGKLDIKKLERWQRERVKDLKELKLNKYGTTTHKDSTGYSFSNPVRSATMSEKSTHYKKLKKNNMDEPINQIAKQLNEIYEEYLIKPEGYESKKSFQDTNFDELIFNYNIQTATHKDSHNSFPYSILTTFGEYQDYQLVFPDYNLILDIEEGDVLIFQGSKVRHCNMAGTGTRISIVGYSRKI